MRLVIYLENTIKLKAHVKEQLINYSDEAEPVILELNQFADYTEEEYQAILGYKPDVTKA